MKAPINSVKHIVQRSLTTTQEQTLAGFVIVTVKDSQPTSASHVVVGAVIKAVFIELWALGESAQPCSVTWTVEKLEGAATAMTQAQAQDLDNYPNKKNILKLGQGVIGDSNSNPIPIMREWVKIPKGKQRFGQDDILRVNLSCVGQADNGLQTCGVAVYKEYQ